VTSEPLLGSARDETQVACRRLGLSDAMILMAGLGIFLSGGAGLLLLWADQVAELRRAATQAWPITDWPAFRKVIHDPPNNRHALTNVVKYGGDILGVFLLAMTPAYFIIRFRRPRPPARDLLCQPGTVAAMAMVFGLFWGTGFLLWVFPDRVNSFTAAPIAVGTAVAISWVILAVSRRWRAEPGWPDRIGRLLGAAAIAAALLDAVVYRI
jgi:hypothetical protein